MKYSENKEKLLEVFDNLRNALKDAQKEPGINEMKFDPKAYSLYYELAADMLDKMGDKAPETVRLLKGIAYY